ncbi:TPA: DUF2913 family protein [Klebsiella pneumoniae]|uniref:DUF2913 family protein n=1 Tax=Klebsiella TaxID=570 RepID=UPI0015EF1118|nr:MULTISPECIES: DUF2913 family protein [Klebsiella]EJA9211352.1 DUF2913 family protein [Escherichia coli]HBY1220045.1 DUF2913 family protein [Klebsiella aerogenes]MCT8891419.1 DUF2913 family protein [Klebsiella quasipneumoniae subsp. similipneumoniae]MDP0618008.1 DUF2913 family protein [Klebsiella pneumoniae]QMH66392.1 DUF2913 family protein [Klebsiella pneumoniae]
MTDTANPVSDELAHLSWCILIAVKLARQEGRIITPSHEHMFIMQWLTNAQKYKLFPRAFAQDIMWFQGLGKRYGLKAHLYKKAEAVLVTQSLGTEHQSYLFRFTQFFEELKQSGWSGYVLPDTPESSERGIGEIASVIYVKQSALVESFNDRGALITPLNFKVKGNIAQIQSLLVKFQFKNEEAGEESGFTAIRLLPD